MSNPLSTALILALFTWSAAQNQTADILIQLDFSINNTTLPTYVLDLIYRSSEHNVTVSDLLDLYSINTTNITTAGNVLDKLNVSQSEFFSLDGLQYGLNLFNLTFREFYNDFLDQHNLAGTSNLKNALEVLGVDVAQFSMGIQYGSPDPWEEFIKGNFSLTNLEEASSVLGLSVEVVWRTVKQLFCQKIVLVYDTSEQFLSLLEAHGVTASEALTLWDELVDVDQVYTIEVFGSVLQKVLSKVTNRTLVGAVTGSNQILIHRNAYQTFSSDLTILSLKALTVDRTNSYDITTVNDTTYQNLVVLQLNSSLYNVIEIDLNNTQDLSNCSLLTVRNNTVVTVQVPVAVYGNYSYSISDLRNDTVVEGGVLVCDNSLYGLVRGVDEDGSVVVDGFAVYQPQPDSGANLIGNKWVLACNTIFTTLIVMVISH